MYSDNDSDQEVEGNGSLKLIGFNWDKENHTLPDKQKIKTLSASELASLDKSNDNNNNGGGGGKRPSQTTQLIELAEDYELWHDKAKIGYATVEIGGHKENHKIYSKQFKTLLSGEYYRSYDKGVGTQVVSNALATIEAKAIHDGEQHSPVIRIGNFNGNIYLDLCNQNWEVIEITPEGWQIISNPPIKFVRRKGMDSLPIPRGISNKGFKLLKSFVNLGDEDDWALLVGFLIGCFMTPGPYPILIMIAEQGSGKSTLARIIRSLNDPSLVPLKRMPKNEHDLMIAASNSRMVILDNLSGIPGWLSDTLCCLSTGAGYSTRELYSDDEEVLLVVQCPIVINGITELASRGDLIDRSIFISLPPIKPEHRLDAVKFNARFEKAVPFILGSLLSSVSIALKNVNTTELAYLPRMADFAKWVAAAEPFLGWKKDSFLEVYSTNREESVNLGLETSPIANAIMLFIAGKNNWEGTATELLGLINNFRIDVKSYWPSNARGLSSQLRRIAPAWRQRGVEVEFVKGRSRMIRITYTEPIESTSQVSAAA